MKHARVFALVPDCHVQGWRYGDLWRAHFLEGLRGAGVDVLLPQGIRFDWARPPQDTRAEETTQARAATSTELRRQILKVADGGLDVVLSYCFTNDIELDVVDEVRGAGIPWINFFCDSVYAFHTVEALARRTSLNWFVESAAESRYRELGVPYIRAPYALNPAALPDASCGQPQRALGFVGTANKARAKLALLFRLAGMDLHLRGWGWPELLRNGTSLAGRARRVVASRLLEGHVGGHLDNEEYIDFLRTSQTLLGLNEGHLPGGEPMAYLKLRDLEFPGMGCAYLAQHHQDLELVFEVGREVRTFRTFGEGRRIALEMSRDREGCRRMGLRARERVLGEHTWSVRLPQLLDAIA